MSGALAPFDARIAHLLLDGAEAMRQSTHQRAGPTVEAEPGGHRLLIEHQDRHLIDGFDTRGAWLGQQERHLAEYITRGHRAQRLVATVERTKCSTLTAHDHVRLTADLALADDHRARRERLAWQVQPAAQEAAHRALQLDHRLVALVWIRRGRLLHDAANAFAHADAQRRLID